MIDLFHAVGRSIGAAVSGIALLLTGTSYAHLERAPQPASVVVVPLPAQQQAVAATPAPVISASTNPATASAPISNPTAEDSAAISPNTLGGISKGYVDDQIQALRNSLTSEIFKYTSTQFPDSPGVSQSTANLAVSQRIDQLANVSLSNITVHGVSGLTAADLPTGITGNYLPLSGGALTGGLTVSGIASTSNLVVSNSFSFGTLTGILKSVAGVVSATLVNLASDVTGVLGIANGGTGTSTAPTYGKMLVGNASGGYDLAATSTLGIVSNWPRYSAATQYSTGDVVIASDGNAYRALTTTTGNTPTSDAGTNWEPYFVNSSLTLNVPSRFADIPAAFTFIKNARIKYGQFITIQVADGTYNYGTTQVNLSHPFGSQIKLLGNTTTPANVTINSSLAASGNGGLFYLTDGNTLGLMDGFKLVGPGNSVTNLGGLFVRYGSKVYLGTHMTIQSFYFSIYVGDGSWVTADGDTLSGGGDGNLFVYNNSGASFANGDSSGANTYFAMAGAVVEHGSSLFATGANFHNNNGQGVFVSNVATANINGATVANNAQYGVKLVGGGTVDDTGVSYSSNTSGNRMVDGIFYSSQSTFAGFTAPKFSLGWAGPATVQLDARSTTAAAYDGLGYQQLSTTGVANSSVANSSGNNLAMFIGSVSQTTRQVYGLNNNAADLTSNGATALAVGTFDAKPLLFGTNNTERARFLSNGNFGIGTSTPYSRLTVWGPDTASTTAFLVANNASTTVFAVYDNGNATYSGSIFQSSDQRLKNNITSLADSHGLAALEQLNPVSYGRIDQPGAGLQLGFIAQEVQPILPELVSTSSATALTPDGTLTLNYINIIPVIVKAIQELAGKISTTAHLVIDTLTARRIETQQLCVSKSDGTLVCVTGDQLAAIGSSGSASSNAATSSPDTTPPVITINGANPAHIQIGDTYSDLGATVTDNVDQNIGVHAFVGSTPIEQAFIDTSATTTYHINYVATDSAGNTATSTRTVVVEN
jgi:hypothetical protein